MDPLMVTIAMTGFNTLFSLVECRESGFDDIIFKPFDFELLKKLLVEYNTKLERWNKTNNT
jgi:CheY-like chemotaxis protein